MTALVLITGNISRPAEKKTSASQKGYVQASVRIRAGETSQFWRVTSFDEKDCEMLLALKEGDGVSVSGRLNVDLYQAKDGQTKISYGLVSDQNLPLRLKARTNFGSQFKRTSQSEAPWDV